MRQSLLLWCILAAVVANLLLYFWPREAVVTPLPEIPRGAKPLVLLSELDADNASAPAPAPQAPARVFTGRDIPLDSDSAPEQPIADMPAVAAAADSVAIASSEEQLAPRLLEIAIRAQRRSLPLPPQRCWLAGPVDGDQLSEQLSANFAAAGISMDLVLRRVQLAPDHWVYLPVTGTQAEIRRVSSQLRLAGVDNFPIPSGDLEGSLSLGLFRSEEGALAVRDKARNMNYAADIYLRPRLRDEAWIALVETDLTALSWPREEGAVPGYDALLLQQRDCPASAGSVAPVN